MTAKAEANGRYHVPVMVSEVARALEPAANGIVLDGTAGGGGHALALLVAYPECRLIAVDRDPDAIAEIERRLAPFAERVRIIRARFDRAAASLGGEVELAGALLDLGISSRQIDDEDRGFTHRDDAPLDMRMEGGEGDGPTAADLLAEASEEELGRIFRRLGNEPRGRALARVIVARRDERPFRTSSDLVSAIEEVYRRPPFAREKSRIFQALRLYLNEELEALRGALPLLRDLLRPGGVFVVLAYHSLEDREVKNAFREWSRSCVCPPEIPICRCRGRALGSLVTRGAGQPSDAEVAANPRARSARLRVWRKAA